MMDLCHRVFPSPLGKQKDVYMQKIRVISLTCKKLPRANRGGELATTLTQITKPPQHQQLSMICRV